tara:strand:+ start:122 stop:610 length:489 start_codon:yes stop_codon:yes gene_type:complete
MHLFGRFKHDAKVNNFSSERLESPNILIIFPVKDDLVTESMECVSKIISSHEKNGSSFSFVIDKNKSGKISLFSVRVIPMEIKKEKFLINSVSILNQLKYKSFDVVVNLNVEFNSDIDMLIERINAKYKIGFVSKYSDLFYNIQVNWDESKSRFKSIINILE